MTGARPEIRFHLIETSTVKHGLCSCLFHLGSFSAVQVCLTGRQKTQILMHP